MTAVSHAVRADRNELPWPPDGSALARLAAVLSEVNRYPLGVWQAELTALVATRNGCAPEQTLLGAGSVRLLDMAWRTALEPGKQAGFVPGFEMYTVFTTQLGGTAVEVPLTTTTAGELEIDLNRLAELARSTPLALVAITTPHNPSGVRCPIGQLADFVARVPQDVLVVLDEAYVEFDEHANPMESAALAVGAPNVVVTRTFSKAYGLAGLRVGYAIANTTLIRTLNQWTTPFSVTDLACAAALNLLQHPSEHDERMRRLRAERAALTGDLRGCGLDVPTSAANFVLVQGHPELATALRDQAIAVSASPLGTRITVGTAADRAAVVGAVRAHLTR